VPTAIAATKLTNAHAKSEQLAMLLINFVFMIVFFLISLFCFGLPWLPTVGGHFQPFTEVLGRI
jgi:hypothetical protein